MRRRSRQRRYPGGILAHGTCIAGGRIKKGEMAGERRLVCWGRTRFRVYLEVYLASWVRFGK